MTLHWLHPIVVQSYPSVAGAMDHHLPCTQWLCQSREYLFVVLGHPPACLYEFHAAPLFHLSPKKRLSFWEGHALVIINYFFSRWQASLGIFYGRYLLREKFGLTVQLTSSWHKKGFQLHWEYNIVKNALTHPRQNSRLLGSRDADCCIWVENRKFSGIFLRLYSLLSKSLHIFY